MTNEDEIKFYHVLKILSEECAEIIHIISKIDRFGLNSENPTSKKENIEILNDEFNDFLGTLNLLKFIDSEKYSECFNENPKKQTDKFYKILTMIDLSKKYNRLK